VLINGTAAGMGLSGRESAGKTGTSNVISGNGTPYAAFGGYTPSLTGYVSVFYPQAPESPKHVMGGDNSCYRLESGGLDCPGEMFGANAPASTWHMTFDHADLGPVTDFVPVPADSPFNGQGNGQIVQQQKSKGKGKGGKGGPGGGPTTGPGPGGGPTTGPGPGGGPGGGGGPGNGGGGGPGNDHRGARIKTAASNGGFAAAVPAVVSTAVRANGASGSGRAGRKATTGKAPASAVSRENEPAANAPARTGGKRR
jgi:membrane peptidoglycan carboxypeptidase